ncbi:MAG: phosphate regulon sensor histidine kinase PhoR [Betaproteobacteria bacterium]|nr:phosphate regulon sensor histidine kinase PhoR [Betaproteobacteria bacterium]
MLAGAGLGSLFWLVLDLRRSARVLAWLRSDPGTTSAPNVSGLWGEVAARVQSQLKTRDRLLAQSEARLSEFLAAIQTSPNGVVLLDAQGHIEWCNRTACEHFGFDAQRDVLQHIGNLVREPVFAAYLTQPEVAGAVVMPGPQSTPSRPVRLAIDLHAYGGGRKLMLSRDVTALEQAEAQRRDFVANVSHEIRTPLTVLAGFVETLQTLPLSDDERQRYLGLMANNAQRMQLLVNDLLTLSRLEGSPAPALDDWHNAALLLGGCEQEARALSENLHPGGQVLHFTVPQDLVLAGALSELVSAMSNLVSNAVRYTPDGGRIEVSWAVQPDGSAEFAVHDSGPGIAPEHLGRITERFYRVDRSRARDTGGTGLGLAIVKHVAQRHGAKLRISSVLGQGSTFVLHLPAQRVRAGVGTPE